MLRICLLNLTLENQMAFFVTYHPHAQNDQYFSDCIIDKALDPYSNNDNVLLAGYFNAKDDEPCFCTFLYQHDLYNLVKIGTCFKNSSKPNPLISS